MDPSEKLYMIYLINLNLDTKAKAQKNEKDCMSIKAWKHLKKQFNNYNNNSNQKSSQKRKRKINNQITNKTYKTLTIKKRLTKTRNLNQQISKRKSKRSVWI